MARWNFKNRIFAISHDQFLTMAKQFKQAAEHSFSTSCDVYIEIIQKPRIKAPFWDDQSKTKRDNQLKEVDAISRHGIDDIDKNLWNKAALVEVWLHPQHRGGLSQAAFATATFKGVDHRQAAFYIHPGGEDAKNQMQKAHTPKCLR